MSPRCRFAHVSVFAACLLFVSTAHAQRLPHGPKPDPAAQLAALKAQQAILQSPNQFGLECCQILQIPSSSFTLVETSIIYGWSNYDLGYITAAVGGGGDLWAPVTLPSGAALDYLDLYYWDTDPANDICATLWAYTGPTFYGDPPGETLIATTCSSGSSGYGYAPIAASGTISNNVFYNPGAGQYVVVVHMTPYTTPQLGFKAVDIWWHRQVSPAPGTATFNDVPTSHPFFQYVEALAASGITAGCQASPPLYCPDAPLTRKQMAAFLAKGYGLYWPF